MSTMSSAFILRSRQLGRRIGLGALPLLLAAMFASGCENLAIGRTCTTLADEQIGRTQAAFNDEALECPTRLCIKPAQAGTATDTAPFCTAECNSSSDCDDNEGRDPSGSARDKRCTSGFVCGVAWEVGPLACKKLCVCKDFVKGDEIPTPASCNES